MQFDLRQTTTILAALRLAQNHPDFQTSELFDDEAQALSDDDIDDLCEAINCDQSPAVVVVLEGGLISHIATSEEGMKIYVVDHDNIKAAPGNAEDGSEDGGPMARADAARDCLTPIEPDQIVDDIQHFIRFATSEYMPVEGGTPIEPTT